MLRFILNFLKFVLVVTGAIFLSTLAINAADSWKNPESSMLAGAISGLGGKTPCPSGMAYVGSQSGAYCIDMYENSASETCAYKNPSSQAETRENINLPNCIPVSVKAAIPWRNISQDQSARACAKAGKRLPSNEEWYFAAIGTPDPSFGWGKSDCNVNRNRGSGDPSSTGSGESCISPLGVYDMVGNVWEWVGEDIEDGKLGGIGVPDSGFVVGSNSRGIPTETNATSSDPNYNLDRFWVKKEGTTGMFRGGFWSSGSDAGLYTVHSEMAPSFVGNAIGFRCVRSVQ